jgi:small subunit ribosomal protein S20
MPNSPSAAKRMRQSVKRRRHNRVTKKVIKTLSKKTMTALAAKDFNLSIEDLKAASSRIDKAGARRVLHPNTAARRKSKLARAYAAAVAKAQGASSSTEKTGSADGA